VPRKIISSTFFGHAFDFSMAFDKFKRPQTIFVTSLLVFSYLYYSEIHAMGFDKLLRALTASELKIRVLRNMKE